MNKHFNIKYFNNINKKQSSKKIQVNNVHQPIQAVFNPVKFD